MKENTSGKSKFALIMIVYLAGIFMGAIDTGIVTPARTIIQNQMLVDGKTGIWMITIYTLAYAASIPVMGKLADRHGRKLIYLISIILFGLGSLFCGISRYGESFTLFLVSRAVQAVGGGGIMPVATAEFGTTFPQEKRGMALGLVGGVYGLANILGTLAGSAILNLFGTENWQFIFFVNLPITLFIVVAGLYVLPNTKEKAVKKIDAAGTLLIVAMVLCLLYGLKQIDFFDFIPTITSSGTYPFLIAFAVLLPIFILAERRAQDPVISLKYFASGRIRITLAVAFASGFVMMGIVFIPQFCENALKVPSGDGGYFTVILGLLSGVSAMLSGRLIDKIGSKRVLVLGFTIAAAGALFLMLVATVHPMFLTVVISLALLGFGLGFTMGAPVNYMMLENTGENESASALATLSLVRSIGTAIAPAIMVGFISHAGASLQTNIMEYLPTAVNLPELPYVQDITDRVNTLKNNPDMAEMIQGVEIPDLSFVGKIELDFSSGGNYEMSDEVLSAFQTSDVTTITEVTKQAAESMFDEMTPSIIDNIQSGLNSGIEGISAGIDELEEATSELQRTIQAISAAPGSSEESTAGMRYALVKMDSSKADMEKLLAEMKALEEAVPGAFEAAETDYLKQIDGVSDDIENSYQDTLDEGYRSIYATAFICSLIALLLLAFYTQSKSLSSDAITDSTNR